MDSADAGAQDCDNRASWNRSMASTIPSYQEALPSCTDHTAITRSGTLFDQTNPLIGKRVPSQAGGTAMRRLYGDLLTDQHLLLLVGQSVGSR